MVQVVDLTDLSEMVQRLVALSVVWRLRLHQLKIVF